MKLLGIAIAANAAFTGAAFASHMCSVPVADWQPRAALEAKLKADGWQVRAITVADGCYEAYAIDARGQKVEVFFNPRSFETVKAQAGH